MSTIERRRYVVAHAVLPAVGVGQDRVAVVHLGNAVVLAVADGSGGMRGGAEAAGRAIRLVTDHAHRDADGDEEAWAALIARLDATPSDQSGLCALVIAAVVKDILGLMATYKDVQKDEGAR